MEGKFLCHVFIIQEYHRVAPKGGVGGGFPGCNPTPQIEIYMTQIV